MSTKLPRTPSLSRSVQRRIDLLCDRFEEAWQAGNVPSIGASLEEIELAARQELLQELVILDLGYRWSRPSDQDQPADPPPHDLPARPLLDDYLAAFPELESLQQLPLSVLREELRVRERFDRCPNREEYAQHFAGHPELRSLLAECSTDPRSNGSSVNAARKSGLRVRCPQCHVPTEIVADTPVTNIHCSGCGSNFSLVSDDIEANHAKTLGTLRPV